MSNVLQRFVDDCKKHLSSCGEGLEYLQKIRNVSSESIDAFDLGFFNLSLTKDYSPEELQVLRDSKIILQTEDEEKYFSLCEESITFPFYNHHNDLVAISFRPILSAIIIKKQRKRKYWHTPFPKKYFMYGLNRAIPHIRETETVIVGEGQLDVVMAHQLGMKNVVAVCGTALTESHISILSRVASTIVIVFDGDEAGERGAEKVKKLKKPGDFSLKKAILPIKEDIDSYLRAYGRDKFEEIIEKAELL